MRWRINLNAEAQRTQRIAKAKPLCVSLRLRVKENERTIKPVRHFNPCASVSIRGYKFLTLVALAIAATFTLDAAQKPASQTKAAQTRLAPSTEAETIEALTAKALKSVVVIKHFGRDGREDGRRQRRRCCPCPA